MIFAGGTLMRNMSRAISVSFSAATITFALTVVMAAVIDYAWVRGSGDPSRFDTLAWMFIFGWPFLVIQLFIPAIIVGIVAGVFSKTWLRRERRIRACAAATMTFALTVAMAATTSYAWVHVGGDLSRFDALAWMFIGWPILVSPLFIPAIVVGIVAEVFPRYS